MGKLICPICGKEIKLMTGKVKLSDGTVCTPCIKKAGFNTLSMSEMQIVQGYTIEQISALVKENENKGFLERMTTHTASVIGPLTFDDKSQTMIYIKGSFSQKVQYNQIYGAEIIENGTTKQKSGAGGAIIGTVVAGPVGTVVGGLMGRKTKNLCSSLKLEINISNSATGPIFIDLITKPVKLDSKEYQKASQLAREMLSKVQEVIAKNGMAQNNTSSTAASSSTADELLKYKNLLDMNAITQEEFDEVKKKLLG